MSPLQSDSQHFIFHRGEVYGKSLVKEAAVTHICSSVGPNPKRSCFLLFLHHNKRRLGLPLGAKLTMCQNWRGCTTIL